MSRLRWTLALGLLLVPLAFPTTAAAATVNPLVATGALDLSTGAGEADWSSTGQIIYQQPDATGVSQLYTQAGVGAVPVQLPSPAPTRHKFNPSWSPDGQWFAVQVERPNYLIGLDHDPSWAEVLLNGLWCDLYVAKADGSAWYKLTETSLGTDGVLFPIWTPDGQHLIWSRLVTRAGGAEPWGQYRLMEGDLSFPGGVPTLSNVRDITPPGVNFIEPGQVSPDGTHVLVSSDVDSGPNDRMNVLELELTTGSYVDLTKGDGLVWHEHPRYSPDGTSIVYMSGVPAHPFSAELVAIHRDGSGWTQLTHFNDPGSPQYAGGLVYAYGVSWSPDGRQALVTTQSVLHYPARSLWLLTLGS